MLVLTRKNGESILIGDEIEITILSTKNDQVKIGIKAPKSTEIIRKELITQISNENLQAADLKMDILSILKKI